MRVIGTTNVEADKCAACGFSGAGSYAWLFNAEWVCVRCALLVAIYLSGLFAVEES